MSLFLPFLRFDAAGEQLTRPPIHYIARGAMGNQLTQNEKWKDLKHENIRFR